MNPLFTPVHDEATFTAALPTTDCQLAVVRLDNGTSTTWITWTVSTEFHCWFWLAAGDRVGQLRGDGVIGACVGLPGGFALITLIRKIHTRAPQLIDDGGGLERALSEIIICGFRLMNNVRYSLVRIFRIAVRALLDIISTSNLVSNFTNAARIETNPKLLPGIS